MGETTNLNWWSPDFSHQQYCGGRLVPGHSASLHHLVDGGNRLGLGCDESYSSVLAGWCSLLAHQLRFRELRGGSCFDIQSLSKFPNKKLLLSIQREKGESRFSCAFWIWYEVPDCVAGGWRSGWVCSQTLISWCYHLSEFLNLVRLWATSGFSSTVAWALSHGAAVRFSCQGKPKDRQKLHFCSGFACEFGFARFAS